jgi:hypothetical protein
MKNSLAAARSCARAIYFDYNAFDERIFEESMQLFKEGAGVVQWLCDMHNGNISSGLQERNVLFFYAFDQMRSNAQKNDGNNDTFDQFKEGHSRALLIKLIAFFNIGYVAYNFF